MDRLKESLKKDLERKNQENYLWKSGWMGDTCENWFEKLGKLRKTQSSDFI